MSSGNTMDILNLQIAGNAGELQQMVFIVDTEEFGVDVLKVQEIIRYVKPVKVPNAPGFVQGVINFRGEIIPVLDIRRIFKLESTTFNEFTVIVVVESSGKIFGLTVDRVLDIINFPQEKIQTTPEFSSNEKTKYLKAMGKVDNRLILLLDLDKLVDFREVDAIFPDPNTLEG